MESELMSGTSHIPGMMDSMPLPTFPMPMDIPRWGEIGGAGAIVSIMMFLFWYLAKVALRKIAEENVSINGNKAFDAVIDNLTGEIQRLTERNAELHEKIDKLLTEVSTLRVENASLKADLYRLSSIIRAHEESQKNANVDIEVR